MEAVSPSLMLAALALVPLLLMSATAFVKITTVLHLVRTAIGVSAVPSGGVIIVLSASLTWLAMAPVGLAITNRATPWLRVEKPADPVAWVQEGIAIVREPLRDFLKANTSSRERDRFLKLATRPWHAGGSDPTQAASHVQAEDLTVLIPAFVVSELTKAFAIGFMVFLPFLVIDWVIATLLMALGLPALNAQPIGVAFKLLLFVAIDGWGLLSQALVASYNPS